VNKFLRTISTRRLLATLAGLIIAVAGGTAIAFAAAGSGRVPAQEPLAQALHQAATAPAVDGISARISFTNNLIDTTDLQGAGTSADPLLTGAATGRLWLSNNHQLRLELQGNNGDAQVLVDNGSFWVYDPSGNTVYKGTLPSGSDSGSGSAKDKAHSAADAIPSVAQIQTDLNRLMQHVNVAGPLPRNVAGQPAYKVEVSPKHDGGLLGDVQLAWDASHGVPLGIAIYARGASTPVLELKATQISYSAVPASVFAIKPPPGAKVVTVSSPSTSSPSASAAKARLRGKAARAGAKHAEVTGLAAVQAHVPFALHTPSTLDGLPRQSVELLDSSGSSSGALVTYGQNLGGIAVIEKSASGAAGGQSSQGSGGPSGLSLPTVSIDGATAQELATPLGTVITFSTGGVEYTVLGSVPPTAAELAAKALPTSGTQ
jgi:outer membrane lipoprotein-sorting protein